MNREEFERIANDELDGVATPMEKEALRRHLTENPTDRERFEALREVFARLKRVGMEEPPPDLRKRTMRAIAPRGAERVPVSRLAWLGELVGGFLRPLDLRGALTFASGVGVGAAAIVIVTGNVVGSGHVRSSDLSGTMAPRPTVAERSSAVERTLRLDGLTVTASTWRTTGGVTLRIAADGDGAQGARLRAAFDRGALHPVALRMDPPTAGEIGGDADGVLITWSGPGTCFITLRSTTAQSAPFDLELQAGDKSARAELEPGSSGSR